MPRRVAISAVNNPNFVYRDYDTMVATMKDLASSRPDLVRLSTVQSLYGLPSIGTCGASKIPCLIHVLHVTNFTSDEELPVIERPEVYVSGEIHGDERVGPAAAIEFVQTLVNRSSDNEWIRRLINTRSVFVTPMTNAVGFDARTREELGIDPNRDYPVDQVGAACMRTLTSRAVNELFRSHMFQLAVTFHAGMETIAVEWGTTNRFDPTGVVKYPSPDDTAQLEMGEALASYAGGFGKVEKYPVGRMNDKVYPVHGGMEDWSYAGSWDPETPRPQCKPGETSQLADYPASRTTYTEAQLRVVNILVETSDSKNPAEATLGSRAAVLKGGNSQGNGHVTRNVRLALALTDLVQPYIHILTGPGFSDASYQSLNVQTGSAIRLEWEVGGAVNVDETVVQLLIKRQTPKDKPKRRLRELDEDASKLVEPASDGEEFSVVWQSSLLSGPTRWAARAADETSMDRESHPFRPEFTACVPITSDLYQKVLALRANTLNQIVRVFVRVRAKVDSGWATQVERDRAFPRGFAPQSHIVNARTNPAWNMTNEGRSVQGKLYWYSKAVPWTLSNGPGHNVVKYQSCEIGNFTIPQALPTPSPTLPPQQIADPVASMAKSRPSLVLFNIFIVIVTGLGIYGFRRWRDSALADSSNNNNAPGGSSASVAPEIEMLASDSGRRRARRPSRTRASVAASAEAPTDEDDEEQGLVAHAAASAESSPPVVPSKTVVLP